MLPLRILSLLSVVNLATAKALFSSKSFPALPLPSYPPITNLSITTGYIPFPHPSLPSSLNASTWYRTVTPPIQSSRPLIVLHGGPGISHLYLRPTFDLFAQISGRKVIYYDQFGGGNSTRYPDGRGVWTPELFMDELDNVIGHLLQVGQEFDIYGHSWGAMFGGKWAAERDSNKGLGKLLLASGPGSMREWSVAARRLLNDLKLGQDVEKMVLEADARGDYENETYVEAMAIYSQNYLCRLATWPDELVETLNTGDDTVHGSLVGGSDFNITGSLRSNSPFPHPLLPSTDREHRLGHDQ
jgi:L-proline amide hydrolase